MHANSTLAPDLLEPRQLLTVILFGIAAWFAAALAVHAIADAGGLTPNSSWISFALVAPGSWIVVPLVQKTARLRPAQLVSGVALATAAATSCDATAFNAFPSLYSSDTATALRCAAIILWGAGWGIALAYAAAYRSNRT